MVEIMEDLREDKVVAFHVPIGIMSRAYSERGYVQFATHAGLCRALHREAIIGDQVIVVEGSDREFMIERQMGVPQDVKGPRWVLNANEDGRKSEWNSRKNHWHSGPGEWYYWCEEMFENGNVLEQEE